MLEHSSPFRRVHNKFVQLVQWYVHCVRVEYIAYVPVLDYVRTYYTSHVYSLYYNSPILGVVSRVIREYTCTLVRTAVQPAGASIPVLVLEVRTRVLVSGRVVEPWTVTYTVSTAKTEASRVVCQLFTQC